MSKFILFLFVIITCLIYESDNSLIKIENNGYSGITIGFSRKLKTDNKAELLENLKSSLSKASAVLYNITKQRAFFKEITFIIPKEWEQEENWISAMRTGTLEKIRFEKYNKADIFVEPEGGVFGNNPYTIQIAGCEKQGLGIYITEKYLQLNSDLTARELVYEWLKYRYGVFDEHGFQGDERYPILYGVPSGNFSYAKVTSCSDKPVKYSEESCTIDKSTGRLTDLGCAVKTELEPETGSSFMFSPTLKNICGSDNAYAHDESSPTKHNALCFENSISMVMDSHKDLKEVSASRFVQPSTKFRYVKESNLRLVLAVDYSRDETGRDVLGILKKTLYRFLQFGISQNFIDIVFYNSDGATTLYIKNVNAWRFPNTDKTGAGCIQCALNNSIEVLNNNKPIEGSTLVLVSKHVLNDADYEALLSIAAKEKVKIHILLCLVDDPLQLNQLKYQFAETDVRIQYIPMTVDNAEYLLYGALKTSIQDDTFGTADDTIMITQQMFTSPNVWINFTFPVDETAKRDLSILFSLKDFTTIYDDTITLSSHDNAYRHDVTFADFPNAEILKVEVPGVKAGEMKLSIKKDSDTPVRVIVFAKESFDSSAIIIRCWLNSANQFISVNRNSEPVILYTEVRSGNYPVRNAAVIASLQYPNKTSITFTVPDDGLGDPDITKDDGIYTRYMTEFTTEGHYILTVSVTGGDRTQIISGKGKDNLCCGSFVPLDNTAVTKAFSRLYFYGSLFVSLPQNSENEDFYPPSRITDFKIDTVTAAFGTEKGTPAWGYYLTFSFSAPGGNYGNDKASVYEIRYFRHRSTAKNNFSDGKILDEFYYHQKPSPETYGKMQVFKLEIPENNLETLAAPNDMVFFAIRAGDGTNKGKTSNIVEVHLPLHPSSTVNPLAISSTKSSIDNNDSKDPNALPKNYQENLNSDIGMIVGIVVGCIILLIAIAVVVFIFIRRNKARKSKDHWEDPANNKPKKVSNEHLPEESTPIPLTGSISPVQSWPANVLMDHYEKVQESKRKNGSDDSMDSSSGDSSHPLKPNPIYQESTDNRYIVNNRCLPSAPFTSSQNSLSQPRNVTQV